MQTLYTKIGPEKLKAIVDRFYDLVFNESNISFLFKTNRSLIQEKQYQFLTQFLGGPQLYTEKYGNPKMRMRHAPHAIDIKAKDEWLRCMKIAIDENINDVQLAHALYNCFPKLADHMVNQ